MSLSSIRMLVDGLVIIMGMLVDGLVIIMGMLVDGFDKSMGMLVDGFVVYGDASRWVCRLWGC